MDTIQGLAVGRRFAVRRYEYGGTGIVNMIGSLLARYATKAMQRQRCGVPWIC